MFRIWMVIIFLLPSAAQAAVPALCGDAPNQAEGSLCAARKLQEATGEMGQAYAALEAKLDPLGKRNLEHAQAAWLRFRSTECDLETGNDSSQPGSGGTIMPMLLDECAVSLTEQRTRDLKDQLKCPGGDLSCEN